MRKALSGIFMGILALSFIVLTTGSSNAAVVGDNAAVNIIRVHYNANGADKRENAWQEGVLVRYSGPESVNLDGWRIHDTYRSSTKKSVWNDPFTNECVLPSVSLTSGQTVYVSSSSAAFDAVTKANIDATYYVYCDFAGKGKGYGGQIFNNMGDTAYLEYRDGTTGTVKRTSIRSYGFENGYYI